MKRKRFRMISLIIVSSIILSCLSGFIPAEAYVTHYFWNTDGQECRIEACLIDASGWPIAYIWDGTWNSPVGSADWSGVWLGVDHFNFLSFLRNSLIWSAPVLLIILIKRQP